MHKATVAALSWFSATSCGGGNCVQVAALGENGVAVRDSKDPDGAILRYTSSEWKSFIDGAKSGEFDHLG